MPTRDKGRSFVSHHAHATFMHHIAAVFLFPVIVVVLFPVPKSYEPPFPCLVVFVVIILVVRVTPVVRQQSHQRHLHRLLLLLRSLMQNGRHGLVLLLRPPASSPSGALLWATDGDGPGERSSAAKAAVAPSATESTHAFPALWRRMPSLKDFHVTSLPSSRSSCTISLKPLLKSGKNRKGIKRREEEEEEEDRRWKRPRGQFLAF
ncbi:hypothetical protein HPP92_003145 [Vanilla planifolia]|uniref:Uncharacterized protein n=1 Tax=Vanilla planifolia TaxID=51239 RepID=A0A835SG30_VANPL|nr:hypothetical protein HPP92_003145 [Vanilla planifolia]